MKTYKTIIRNETEGRLSLCTDFFGDRKANLAPGQEGYTIGVWFMNFARYSKVVYQERGEVSLTKRLNFKTNFKKEQLVLRLENKHDLIENYKFGSLYFGSYTVPYGVPIFVPVHPLDPLASEPYPKTGPVKNVVFWLSNCSANCRGVKPPSELCGRNSL